MNHEGQHKRNGSVNRQARIPAGAAAAVIVSLALIVLVVAAELAPRSTVIEGGHWILSAISGRMFLACAAVLAGSLAATVVLLRVLWRAGAGQRRKGVHPQGGTAIVEFAMVLPVVLMLVLAMTQSTMLMAGNLCVHYSAFCAARGAVVQVPLNLNAEEPPNYVTAPSASAKMNRIKASAAWALTPVSCGSEQYPVTADAAVLQAGLNTFFRSLDQDTPNWVTNQLPHRLSYALDNTIVTLAPPVSGGLYAEHEDLVVGVEHTFYLSVPYASRIFKAFGEGKDLGFGDGQYGLVIRAGCRLPNEGVQDFVDVEKFDDAPASP